MATSIVSNVQEFMIADSWERFQADHEVLSSFSGGVISPGNLSSVKGLTTILDKKFPLVKRSEIEDWFGLGKIPALSLEDAAQRFFENRLSEYRKNTHDFLYLFLESVNWQMNQVQIDVWSLTKSTVDATFSMKIGMQSYGELDFILARFHPSRFCKTLHSDLLTNYALSHVLSRYFLSEEYLQSQRERAILKRKADALNDSFENDPHFIPVHDFPLSISEAIPNHDETSSTSSTTSPSNDPKDEDDETLVRSSQPKTDAEFYEEWLKPTICVLRIPPVFFWIYNRRSS